MEPVRVLHVLDALNQGGIENLIMNVYRAIDRSKVQFDFALRRESQGYFDDEIERLGGKIYYFESESKSIDNYRKSLSHIIDEKGPYKAIHSHCYFFSGYILRVAKKKGISVRIAHSHDTSKGRKDSLKRKTYEEIMRCLIRAYATDMVCCSNEAGKYVFGEKVNYKVIYNGIDVDRFKFEIKTREEYRKKLGLDDALVLIHVGRFADQKNHSFILDILKDLSPEVENWKAIFIGNGELLEKTIEKAKTLGINDRIIYLSGISNPEYYYNASDVFVFPSKYEGLGIVAVEAQVNGLPSILSSKITSEVGITDLAKYLSIDEGTSKWIDAVKHINNQKNVDRSSYSQLIKSTQFDIENTAATLQEIYLR